MALRDVRLFTGSGDFGDRHSSDSLDVEEVDGAHISLLAQPDDDDVI